MQVSKWLGHSNFVLTLTTYADYISKDDLVGDCQIKGGSDLALVSCQSE
jgi:hypothetical protein